MQTSFTTPTAKFNVKSFTFKGYIFHLATNNAGKQICHLNRILTSGRNKGGVKVVEAYRFDNTDKRDEYITRAMAKISERIERKVQEVEEHKALKASVQSRIEDMVGKIFSTSWGYDQTNVDFYQVIGSTKASLRVQQIKCETVEGSAGNMCCHLVPLKDQFVEDRESTIHIMRVHKYSNQEIVSIIVDGHRATEYTGGATGQYCSWYA